MVVVAQTHANGDSNDPLVLAQFKEIIDTLQYERNAGETLSLMQIVKSPNARKRVTLACSAAVFSTIAGEGLPRCFEIRIDLSDIPYQGNVIASYYLGSMLDDAGITSYTTQLQVVSNVSFSPRNRSSRLIKQRMLY